MKAFYLWMAFLLVGLIGAGLVRIIRGPTPADRMLAAQLFGTTGVAVLLLLSHAMSAPALRDVALVFAVLSAVSAVAFIRTPRLREPGEV